MGEARVRAMPPPWKVTEVAEAFRVEDASGKSMAYVYFVEERLISSNHTALTKEEARRVAVNIARLPELLQR